MAMQAIALGIACATLLASAAVAQEPKKASFDCLKAKSASARLICGDDELGDADKRLGQFYRNALERGGTPEARQRRS